MEVVGCDLPKPLNSLCYEEVVLLLDAQSAEFRLAYAKLGKEDDSILNIGIGLFREVVEVILSINPKLIELILSSSAILSFSPSGNIGIYSAYALACSHYHNGVVIHGFVCLSELDIEICLLLRLGLLITANGYLPSSLIVLISLINTYTLFALDIFKFRPRVVKAHTLYAMVSSLEGDYRVLIICVFVSESALVSLIRANGKETYELIVVLVGSTIHESLEEAENRVLINRNPSSCLILSNNKVMEVIECPASTHLVRVHR